MSDSPPEIREIHVTFGHIQHRITKYIIRKEEIYRQQDLISHIKRELQIPFEFELITEGKILKPFSELFTSPDPLIIDVVFKYIWNFHEEVEKAEEGKGIDISAFFRQRKIDFQKEILDACEFQNCLDELKRDVSIEKRALLEFRRAVWNVMKVREMFENVDADKSYVVGKVILLAVNSEVFFQISSPFERKNYCDRPLKGDHAVTQMFSDRIVLFVCEDYSKRKDLSDGVMKFFDQGKNFSKINEGKDYPFVYGIATNFQQWRFCCYYSTGEEAVETKKNFYVSKVFRLMDKDFGSMDHKEEVKALELLGVRLEELIGWIRGLFRNDIDQIVSEILGLEINNEKFKERMVKQEQRERKYLMDNLEDLEELLGDEVIRAHPEGRKLLKKNNGECLSVPIPRTFHDNFIDLIHQLYENQDPSFQKRTIQNFLTSWTITLENISEEFDNLSAPIKIPLELTEKRLLLSINSYMKSKEFSEKALTFALEIIKKALAILQEKDHNEKDLDKDLYAFLSASLDNIFDENKRFALSLTFSSLLLQSKGDEEFYKSVEISPILAEAANTISHLLNWLENSPMRFDVRKAYPHYLERDIIGEFLAILPQKVTVIHELDLPDIYGMCLSTGRIVLRRSLLDETKSKREIKIAKAMITILHEMGNLQSRTFYSGNKYLRIAEETAFDKEKEGFYLEEGLLGGALGLAKIDSDIAKLILDIDNLQEFRKI